MVSATSSSPRPKNALKHGFAVRDHGGKMDPTYVAWVNLRARCDNKKRPDYQNYGGRGIYYTPTWIRFENFLADMGRKPEGMSIDRIDNDGPYCKENCRWVGRLTQNANKRNIVMYEFRSKRNHVAGWAAELGINRRTIQARLLRGWTVEKALSVSVKEKYHGFGHRQ